jgi:DNA adenine methylase
MRKKPSQTEVYNDLDSEIVNAFRMIRERPVELEALLRATPYAREEFQLSYTRSDDPIEQARRTIVRAYLGHGSSSLAGHITGFRSKTHSQHAGGSREWKTYPDQIRLFAERLSGVIIENLDAMKLIDVHDGLQTLFYVDPPYLPELRHPGSKHARKGEYRHELTRDDHIALLKKLMEVQGYVIISGYPSDLYDETLYGWTRELKKTLADRAQPRTEVLWMSPNIPPVQAKLFQQEY